MTVEYSKQALSDLDGILSYYAESAEPRTTDRFALRFHEVMARIERQPESAPTVVQRPGVRVVLLNTFPYKVFHRIVDTDRIRVLHVRHMSRRPW